MSHSAEVRDKRELIPQQGHPYLVVVVHSPHHYSITSEESATDMIDTEHTDSYLILMS